MQSRRSRFGTKGSQVRILSPRHKAADLLTKSEQVRGLFFRAPDRRRKLVDARVARRPWRVGNRANSLDAVGVLSSNHLARSPRGTMALSVSRDGGLLVSRSCSPGG